MKVSPLARHARHKQPRPTVQLLKMALVGLLVLAVSATSVVGYIVWDGMNRYTSNAIELPSKPAPVQKPPTISFDPYPGEVTFLLSGTDECEPEFAYAFGDRCAEYGTGARNDVTLLVHIPADHSTATIISFPRDLMLDFPTCTAADGSIISEAGYQQLNSAYDRGGLGCIASVVESISGLSIPFAAKISWGGVINVTDKLGGVDVCVANGIYDRYTGLDLPPGTHSLQGLQALQFLRTRHGLSDGSDLARISNQQLYMSALLKKLTSDGTLDDLFGLLGIADVMVNNVEHSSSLNDPATLVSLALLMKQLPLDKVTFVQIPNVSDPNNPNRVVQTDGATAPFWEAIRTNQLVGIDQRDSGALVEEVAPVLNDDGTVVEQPAPVASAPGLKADANACANGAG